MYRKLFGPRFYKPLLMCYNSSMKLLAFTTIMLAAFSVLSCAGSPDPVRRFPGMVADMDPISTGSTYARVDRLIGRGLNTVSVETIFHPRLNAVSLEFRHEFVTYRQFWDETARRHFIAAVNSYNADFDARNLIGRHRRTRNIYGTVAGRLEWQTARFTTNHVAYPTIELGYRFREVNIDGRWENRPFFATLMRPAMSEETVESGIGRQESRMLIMYFTRAQAAELVGIFEQAYLMRLIGFNGAHDQNILPPVDVYDRFTDEQD